MVDLRKLFAFYLFSVLVVSTSLQYLAGLKLTKEAHRTDYCSRKLAPELEDAGGTVVNT